jgi:glutathione S-transferase
MSESSPQPSDVRKDVILYVIPGSHACRTAMLMLDHKGVPFRMRTLPSGMHPMLIRAFGFAGGDAKLRDADGRRSLMLTLINQLGTVPAMRFDGERVQTNHEIARFLERVRPEPRLFPADPELRGEVEEAERWGDRVLQMAARRITFSAALEGGLDRLHDRANSGRLGPLLSRSETSRMLVSQVAGRTVFSAAGAEDRLIAALPEMLDKVDAWIAAGVLGTEQLNAADFQIAPSIALLAYRLDLREQIEARPLGALAERVLPEPALGHR